MKGALEAFGLFKDCIKWIMAMVSVAFLYILLNGSPPKPFCPSRGIRRRYPLSCFLFVIMVEGLSRSIKAENINKSLIGLKLHDNALPSTHQQLGDDTLLMGIFTIKLLLYIFSALVAPKSTTNTI